MEMARKTDGKTKIKGKNIKRKKNFHYISSDTNKTKTGRTYLTDRITQKERQPEKSIMIRVGRNC
jgi:hypothetical protein